MIDRIIESALRLPGLVLLLVVGVIGAGIHQYRNMPVDAFPDVSPIMVPIFAEGHGMAPEEIERLVTYPVESAMNGLPGVTQIKSTSAFGMAVIYKCNKVIPFFYIQIHHEFLDGNVIPAIQFPYVKTAVLQGCKEFYRNFHN